MPPHIEVRIFSIARIRWWLVLVAGVVGHLPSRKMPTLRFGLVVRRARLVRRSLIVRGGRTVPAELSTADHGFGHRVSQGCLPA